MLIRVSGECKQQKRHQSGSTHLEYARDSGLSSLQFLHHLAFVLPI